MGATLKLRGDSGGAVRAITDLQTAMGKVEAGTQLTAKEMKKLEQAALNVVKNNEAPLEKYNRRMGELAQAVTKGKLGLEDAEKAAQKYGVQLERAGQHGDKAFGESAIKNLVSFAGTFGTISGLVATVVAGLKQMQAEGKAAADRVVSSVGAVGELQQVSTSPEDFQKLKKQAEGFVQAGVFAPDQQASADHLIFSMRNAGYNEGDSEFIKKLGTSKKVAPENLQKVAEGLKKYQDIFGAEEAGSVQDIGQKVYQAAGATASDFATVSKAATLYGSEASMAGISDEEALAAFVTLEKRAPSPEQAATREKSFLNQVVKRGLGKGTLSETIGGIQKRIEGGESAFDVLGEAEAVSGYSQLQKFQGDYTTQLKNIQTAPERNAIGASDYISADPGLSAARYRQEAEGSQAITQQGIDAERGNLYAGVLKHRMERAEKRGKVFELDETLRQYTTSPLQDVLGMENYGIQQEANNPAADPEDRKLLNSYLERMANGIESIEQNQKQPVPQPHGPAE